MRKIVILFSCLCFISFGQIHAGIDFDLRSADVRFDGIVVPVAPDAESGNNHISAVKALGDVNGDGQSDFAVGGYNAIGIFFGKDSLSAWRPVMRVEDADVVLTEAGSIGNFTIVSGDVNGDGLSDIAIHSWSTPGYLIFGRSVWPPRLPLNLIANVELPRGNIAIGNFNGDRFMDIVIGQTGAQNTLGGSRYYLTNYESHLYLFLGREGLWARNLMIPEASATWVVPMTTATTCMGHSFNFVGDLNSDGFEELTVLSEIDTSGLQITGAGRYTYQDRKIHLFSGNREGRLLPTTELYLGNGGGFYNPQFSSASDFNNDISPDFVYGDGTTVRFYSGLSRSLTGFTDRLSNIISSYHLNIDGLSEGRDLNSDSFSDLLIGESGPTLLESLMGTSESPEDIVAYLLLGRSTPLGDSLNVASTYDIRFTIPHTLHLFFSYPEGAVSMVGDVNGGGQADILIAYRSQAYLIFGETLFPSSPSSTFIFPEIIYHRPLIFPDDIDPRPWPEKIVNTELQEEINPEILKTTDTSIEQVQNKESQEVK